MPAIFACLGSRLELFAYLRRETIGPFGIYCIVRILDQKLLAFLV